MTSDATAQSFELDVGTPARAIHGRVVGAAPEGQALRPCVVMVHGYLASMDWGFMPRLARSLVARKMAVVLFDFSGGGLSHSPGSSSGALDDERGFSTNTYAQELEDLAAVRELVRCGAARGVDTQRLGLFGHSRGAAMALVHAAELGGYRALCSWSAGGHVARYDAHRLVEWERDGHLKVSLPDGRHWRLERDLFHDFTNSAARYDLVHAAARFKGAWALVNGERDRAVPLAEVREYLDRVATVCVAPPTALVVEGAGHNFGAAGSPPSESTPALRTALEFTTRFFEEQLMRRE